MREARKVEYKVFKNLPLVVFEQNAGPHSFMDDKRTAMTHCEINTSLGARQGVSY